MAVARYALDALRQEEARIGMLARRKQRPDMFFARRQLEFGFWMIPLELLILAQDVPFLHRPMLLAWIERRWAQWNVGASAANAALR